MVQPVNFDTDYFAGIGYGNGGENLWMRDSDPAQYNKNVMSFLNDVRQDLIRGNVGIPQVPAVTEYMKSLATGIGDPSLYYESQINFIGNMIGRNAAMGENTEVWKKELQNTIPEAINNGVDINNINNSLNSSYNAGVNRGNYQISTSWDNAATLADKLGPMIPLMLAGAGAATGLLGAGAAAGEGAIAAEAGLGAGTGISAGEGALTTGEMLASGGFTPMGGASFGIEPGAAYATGVGGVANAPLGSLSWNAPEIGGSTANSAFGSLNATLPSAGSVGGAGAGLSAELAPGTILGTGLEGGGSIGSSYAAGANGLPATDFFGNPISASSINFGGVPNTVAGTGMTNTGNNNLSKLLKQGAGSGLTKSLGQLATSQVGEAIPAIVRGNQNPFVMTQNLPIQDTTQAKLASLLKQG